MISYDPLWHTLLDKKLGKLELCKKAGFATSTLAKLGKNEPVALTIIERICICLECKIEDVVRIETDPDA